MLFNITNIIKASTLLLATTALSINTFQKRNLLHDIGDGIDHTGELIEETKNTIGNVPNTIHKWGEEKGDQAKNAIENVPNTIHKWGEHNEKVAKEIAKVSVDFGREIKNIVLERSLVDKRNFFHSVGDGIDKTAKFFTHKKNQTKNLWQGMNAWGKHNEEVARKVVNNTVNVVTKKVWPALNKFGRDFATGVKKIYKGQFRCSKKELPICLGIGLIFIAATCPLGVPLMCVVSMINGEECFRRNCHLDTAQTPIPFGPDGKPVTFPTLQPGSEVPAVTKEVSTITTQLTAAPPVNNPLVMQAADKDGKAIFLSTESSSFVME